MGTSLYWEPVNQNYNSLGRDLKTVLKLYCECDYIDTRLDGSNLEYLMGVKDATDDVGVNNAVIELIDAIRAHGEIRVFESS